MNSVQINASSFLICSQTTEFDNNMRWLAEVPKVYSCSITQLLSILQSGVKKDQQVLGAPLLLHYWISQSPGEISSSRHSPDIAQKDPRMQL